MIKNGCLATSGEGSTLWKGSDLRLSSTQELSPWDDSEQGHIDPISPLWPSSPRSYDPHPPENGLLTSLSIVTIELCQWHFPFLNLSPQDLSIDWLVLWWFSSILYVSASHSLDFHEWRQFPWYNRLMGVESNSFHTVLRVRELSSFLDCFLSSLFAGAR